MLEDKIKGKKGISLYFAILVISLFLAIGASLSTILISQLKMIKEIENSVLASMAADTGIEKTLFELYQGNVTSCQALNFSGYLDLNKNNQQDTQEPTFETKGIPPGTNCSAQFCCVHSLGSFKGTKRKIEILF